MRGSAWGRAALACAFVFVSCGSDTTEEKVKLAQLGLGCVLNSDCAKDKDGNPLVCAFRLCHIQCETSKDCDPGLRCVLGDKPAHVCQLPDDVKCAYTSECRGDQVCGIDGECRDQCASDRDCVTEQICKTGTCAEAEELVDGGLPISPSLPDDPKGQPCNYTSECSNNLVCRNNICDLECLGKEDCPDPNLFECVDTRCKSTLDGGPAYCVPGAQVKCDCPGSGTSIQVCLPNASGYGPCDCG